MLVLHQEDLREPTWYLKGVRVSLSRHVRPTSKTVRHDTLVYKKRDIFSSVMLLISGEKGSFDVDYCHFSEAF